MATYNFDEILDRRGTANIKHDRLKEDYGRDDLLPMWVADMDFRSPDCVMQAIQRRAEHPSLGYTFGSASYYEAVTSWLSSHYRINARREELHFIPGIVAGIAFALQALTRPGDKVLILTPVYPPFVNLPSWNSRELVCSKLRIVDGRFAIDFDDMAVKARGCKMMIFANPHNPGGTVWSRDDLLRVAEICHRERVIVIDDEIHADLTLPAHQHTSFTSVSQEAKECAIMFFSPSKTFNIAGLASSTCYIANEELRRRYYGYLESYEIAHGNVFAYTGAEAAFRYGEPWLKELLVYLQGNVEFTRSFLSSQMPKASAVLPEASYLVWLDLSGYGYSHEETWQRLLDRARVALNDGTTFGGDAYRNCFRINIGCPRSVLNEALQRIRDAMA